MTETTPTAAACSRRPVVQDRAQERLDSKAAIAHFGIDALRPFMRTITMKNVRLKRVRSD